MSWTNALRKPLPRAWTWFVTAVAGLAGLLVLAHLPQLHVYLKSWGATSPKVSLPWERFSSDMDERALLAAVPLGLRCIDEPKARNGLGNRVCYASVDAVEGAPALTVAFFLDGGRLKQGVVQLPWWGHHAMARALAGRLGMPAAVQDVRVKGVRLVQWRLAGGSVNFNRDPGWDPLAWSAVLWTPLQPTAQDARASR